MLTHPVIDLHREFLRQGEEIQKIRVMRDVPQPWPHVIPRGYRDPKGAA